MKEPLVPYCSFPLLRSPMALATAMVMALVMAMVMALAMALTSVSL
jgi:hypothetical protein